MKKRKQGKIHRRFMRVQLPGMKDPIAFPVKVRDATKSVELSITQLHILQGVQGSTVSCAIQCGVHEAQGLFSHPCHLIEVTKLRIFVATKVNKLGHPVEAVRYRHNGGQLIEMYDPPGGKERLLQEKQARIVTLSPPTEPLGYAHHVGPKASGRLDKSRSQVNVRSGPGARLYTAGHLIID